MRLMWLYRDGEISSSMIFVIVKRRVGRGGGVGNYHPLLNIFRI